MAHTPEYLAFFRLSPEQVEIIRRYQNGKCPICGHELKQDNIDHNHVTGEVCGLLCWKCNKALGFFLDCVDRLRRAIEYKENPPARHALGGPHYGNTGRIRKIDSTKKLSRGRRKAAAPKISRACPVARVLGE